MKRTVAFSIAAMALTLGHASAQDARSLVHLCATTADPQRKLDYCTKLAQSTRDVGLRERAFKGRGNANMGLSRYADAAADFTRIIQLNPRVAGYFDNRLNALRALGRFREALIDANSSIQLAPGYSFAYRSRALVYVDLEQYDLAIADFDRASELAPGDIGLLVERGRAKVKAGRDSDALSDFSRAIAADPNQMDAVRERGLTYARLGMAGPARSDLSVVAASRPNDVEVARALITTSMPQRNKMVADTQPVLAANQPAASVVQPTPATVQTIAAAGQPAAQTNIVVQSTPTSANGLDQNTALAMTRAIGSLEAQISTLSEVLKEQSAAKEAASPEQRAGIDATIDAIKGRVSILQKDYASKDVQLKGYLTSVKPNDRDLYLTARRSSEIYPKIPFYIPGTAETGEFWVEPTVSDEGQMRFSFKFVDIAANVEKVRGTIEMSLAESEDAQKALFKLHEWSKIAHDQKLRKAYEKRITCFPTSDCPPDGERVDGKASTEIRFNVYEDGSTAGRIQRNKGRFVEGYNVSIDSSMLLQAYLTHVIKEAKLEFRSGTQEKKDLDKLFE